MKICFLQKLCKLYPVLHIIEVGRLVVWVRPQSWRLVPTAGLDESVEN